MRAGILGTAALALGLAMTTLAWGEDESKTSNGWFTRWFSSNKSSSKKEKIPEPSSEDLAKAASSSTSNTTFKRSQAEAAYHRRLEVCLKLQSIALANQDDELLRKAEQLEQRIWANYQQRTAQLPKTLLGSTPEGKTSQRQTAQVANSSNRSPARSLSRAETPKTGEED